MGKRKIKKGFLYDAASLRLVQAVLLLIALGCVFSLGLTLFARTGPVADLAVEQPLPALEPVAAVPRIDRGAESVIDLLFPVVNFGELSFWGAPGKQTPTTLQLPEIPALPDPGLAARIAQADYALLQGLARFGLNQTNLQLLQEEIRLDQNLDYYRFHAYAVLPPETWQGLDADQAFVLMQDVADSLRVWAADFRLQRVEDDLFFVMSGETVTHSVRLGQAEPALAAPAVQEADARPKLSIIMDDMGQSLSAARRVTALPYLVTLSIWPQSTHASFTANLARAAGRQVFIHLPMEPFNAASHALEPDTLLVGMDSQQILEILSRALYLLPEAQGLNNHMGSRFTADLRSMELFCAILRQTAPDLLIVDSRTHQTSQFSRQAEAAGLQSYSRDLFLDEVDEVAAILAQLDQAVQLARSKGSAIVIGHPRAATLEALELWQGYRNADIAIVPVGFSAGVHTPNQE